MTTENVAVLFSDMVGSTALASSLAQDAADALRREHFAILRQAIAAAGGTEVKNLGDGLMVVFGAASAALSVGLGTGPKTGSQGSVPTCEEFATAVPPSACSSFIIQ